MACLIVFAMRVSNWIIHLLTSYDLIARLAEPIASVLIGGVLRRETSHWNRKLSGITFLDSAVQAPAKGQDPPPAWLRWPFPGLGLPRTKATCECEHPYCQVPNSEHEWAAASLGNGRNLYSALGPDTTTSS